MTFQDDQLSPGYNEFELESFVGSNAEPTI
jgi:hypothetical protein